MSAHISAKTANALRARIDQETTDPIPNIAGIIYCAVDRNGDSVFSHASGNVGLGVPRPMSLDTVMWLASCTKLITGIACMQLVEQGQLALDDSEQVERLAPELKEVKVLIERDDGSFDFVEKERGITLRMLLTHICMSECP